MARKIKEVVLQNKDKLYFFAKMKGKEYRQVKKVTYNDIEINPDSKGEDVKIKLGDLIDVFKTFPIICQRILRKDEEIKPTLKYIDELDLEDVQTIEDILNEVTKRDEKKA